MLNKDVFHENKTKKVRMKQKRLWGLGFFYKYYFFNKNIL